MSCSYYTGSVAHYLFFFFTDTATTEIYTLSLHDALPISVSSATTSLSLAFLTTAETPTPSTSIRSTLPRFRIDVDGVGVDRKSTRLNSSHSQISYAVFCLKKKKKKEKTKKTINSNSMHRI